MTDDKQDEGQVSEVSGLKADPDDESALAKPGEPINPGGDCKTVTGLSTADTHQLGELPLKRPLLHPQIWAEIHHSR